MRIGSLFAGIGGFDLAARWMGWETAWFSEIDRYASNVLTKHWPGVPNHGDITKIDFTKVEPVDMLCGGFPCQNISNAGKRAGIGGERSGLWGEYARAIRELRPRYVVVENVAALLGRGLERVLGDLAAVGYDAEWEILSAADVGAPHLRQRVWIVAYPPGVRCERDHVVSRGPEASKVSRWMLQPSGSREAVADTPNNRQPRPGIARAGWDGSADCRGEVANAYRPGRRSLQGASLISGGPTPCDGSWWRVEPDVGRLAHWIPSRVDRLKGLGNAIVPQCAYQIFQAIEAREAQMRAA